MTACGAKMSSIPERVNQEEAGFLATGPTKKELAKNGPATSSSPDVHIPVSIQAEIETLGRGVFASIGKSQPSLYRPSLNIRALFSQAMMRWTMTQPELKADLFRLVDVLPSLRSNEAITRHFNEYLGAHAKTLPAILRWALSPKPGSPIGNVAAFFVKRGVREMAGQFIAGTGPKSALRSLRRLRRSKLAYTVDLLGEYTLSEPEALDYFERYKEAFAVLGAEGRSGRSELLPLVHGNPGEERPVCVSVKLSALYSQCSALNFDRSVATLQERLATLVRLAIEANAQVYVDAEDSGTNPIIYQVFENVFGSEEFKSYPYPGIVLQAYSKNAVEQAQRLLDFAKRRGAPIAIRLVKGAYWDSETINAALNDWPSPLLKHKESSDAQFEYISRKLLDAHELCLPAFASHNVRSLCHAVCYAESIGLSKERFELQMLYGMAEPIAKAFADRGFLVRLYVPLGDLFVGMGYLVRRLLENTSNESFLKHTFFDKHGIAELLREPCFKD